MLGAICKVPLHFKILSIEFLEVGTCFLRYEQSDYH